GGCPYNRRTVFHNGYVHWRSCLMPVTIPLKDQAYCGGGSRADSCKNLGHNNVHPHPIGATTAACKVSPSCTVPWHPSLPGRQCNYWMEGTGMLSACGGDPTTFWVTNCFYTHHCKTSSGSGCLVKYSACECSTDRCRGQGDGNPSATVGCSAAACLAGYNPDCATGYYNCSGAGLTDGYCFCRYPGTGFYNPP
ncbi:MAG: hypothetical protein ACE5JM_10900, partial [Armatimonadota bacterium]